MAARSSSQGIGAEGCDNCGASDDPLHLDEVRGRTKGLCPECCSCPACSETAEHSESLVATTWNKISALFGR
jgi:hypothetical protein